MRRHAGAAGALALTLLLPASACAHMFAQPYTLPVPFSIYAYAATAALLLSFAVVGVAAAAPKLGSTAHADVAQEIPGRVARPISPGRVVGMSLLVLCIASGLLGTQDAYANFGMTFFWIVFVLGATYAVALAGDFYACVNPWESLVLWLDNAAGTRFTGRARYPAWLGPTPALVLYMVFIWIELFGGLRPRGLAVALLAYTAINFLGAHCWGRAAWFRHGEFFAVFFGLMGRMAPRAWSCRSAGDGRWRAPFAGLLDEPARHPSLVLFILFMLSSTAFDGLHATLAWASLYWKGLYPALAPWLDTASPGRFQLSTRIYHLWQSLSLLVSPFVYLAVYAGFVRLMKAITRSPLPTRTLVLRFAMSLVPIAFVYHVTHYYTLLLAQGGQIVRLASDPFGFGWNLFGTARVAVAPVMLEMGTIWYTQVGLILLGHIVGVYLAHIEALHIFAAPRLAALSQLPMLALMVAFTNFGLWILSLPLAGGS